MERNRKMIETDLFEFAYVPDWYGQLEQLAEMALPEAWRFRKPQTEYKNTDCTQGSIRQFTPALNEIKRKTPH